MSFLARFVLSYLGILVVLWIPWRLFVHFAFLDGQYAPFCLWVDVVSLVLIGIVSREIAS